MSRIIALLLISLSFSVAAADAPQFELIIKDHRFQPAELTIPANQKVKLVVKNEDSTPEEFESHSLNREKVIAGKSQAVIWIGPLPPGEHKFFGEFNEATAQGRLIIK
jgi:hypothetical protein